MSLYIEEKDGVIKIGEYSDSNGGFEIVVNGNTFDLYEIKPDQYDGYYSGQYDDILEAIKVGRSWT